jgi:cysteine-rich repeat protein
VLHCGSSSSSSALPGSEAGVDATSAADGGQPTPDGATTGNDASRPSEAGADTSVPPPHGDGGPGCGNGTVEGTEQCDDGNLYDLDGCDSSCRYEVIQRMTDLSIGTTAGPAFCVNTGNALGTKLITSLAIGQLNPPLQKAVVGGTLNVFTQFLGLSDLTGASGTGFQMGVLNGALDPAKGTWPAAGGTIDWSFLVDPSTVSQGQPTGLLQNGTITAGALTAGPSTVNLALSIGGSVAIMTMRDAKISATIPSTPAPDAPAPPPAKIAAGLTVFQTMTATGADQGLCGDVTVASLAQIPVPSALTTGTTKCSEGYTSCASGPVSATCNSLLDVFVGGCSLLGGSVAVINPTQPDVAAGTSVQTLSVGANKKVTLPSATDDDAYSAYLQFTANRAHFSGESCTTSAECQGGQACTSKVCQ